MKKLFRFIVFAFILLSIVACGSKDKEETVGNEVDADKEKTSEITEEEEGTVEVEKGLLNVEVTLPSTFFEGDNIEEVIDKAKENGVKEVVQNDDGSLTYKMSKQDHKKMLEEMHKGVLESIEEIKSDNDFASIKDISANKDFSTFTVTIDVDAYENSFDGFAMLGLAMSGMYFQLFNGVDANDIQTTIILKDEATGEVYNEVVYPEALNDIDE